MLDPLDRTVPAPPEPPMAPHDGVDAFTVTFSIKPSAQEIMIGERHRFGYISFGNQHNFLGFPNCELLDRLPVFTRFLEHVIDGSPAAFESTSGWNHEARVNYLYAQPIDDERIHLTGSTTLNGRYVPALDIVIRKHDLVAEAYGLLSAFCDRLEAIDPAELDEVFEEFAEVPTIHSVKIDAYLEHGSVNNLDRA